MQIAAKITSALTLPSIAGADRRVSLSSRSACLDHPNTGRFLCVCTKKILYNRPDWYRWRMIPVSQNAKRLHADESQQIRPFCSKGKNVASALKYHTSPSLPTGRSRCGLRKGLWLRSLLLRPEPAALVLRDSRSTSSTSTSRVCSFVTTMRSSR